VAHLAAVADPVDPAQIPATAEPSAPADPAAAPAPPGPETRIVEVTVSVHGLGRTPEQARREALQRARDEAVAEAAGIRVAAQQLRLRTEQDGALSDGFSYLVQTSTEGRIVREQVTYRTRLEGEIPVYEATLVAEVVLEEGVRDPGFTLDLATEPATRIYRDGEALVLEVTASRRCYLTLIQLASDGRLAVLVPNRFLADNEIDAGETVRFPGESAGFEIRAQLPDGREREHERLLAVATLDPVEFTLDVAAGEELASQDEAAALTALNRWLLRIPVARRTEALWAYEIAK
jgi:hypothetical protein